MATETNLGGHPAWNMVKIATIFLVATIIVVGVALLMNQIVGALVGLFAAFVWTFALGPALLGKFIAAFLTSRVYKEAKRLVADGKLIPSYVGRNQNCEGLAIVDEQNRRVYINGNLYDFADVKSISSGWERKGSSTEHYVEIVMKHGTAPMQKVWFDYDRAAETFYHRLGNNLGFAES